jgi:precorrin-6B methylase 2
MVEALQLAPGHSVLDVGCGCGMVAALASILVGPRGHVVGIDVRRDAVEISKGNVRRLNETSHE